MSTDNFIEFKCPYCGADNCFPETAAETAQACPHCQDSVVVPLQSCALGGKLPLPCQTARLALRRLKPQDWRDLVEMMADEDLFTYLTGYPESEEQIIQWLENDPHARLTQTGQNLHLAVERLDGGKVLGYLTFSYQEETHRQVAFGLILNRACHGQGYGTEAVRGLLHFGFQGIGLHRLFAQCDTRNAAACRMLAKAGLRREGEFLKDRWVKGEWVSSAWYAMLREEYRE